MSDNNYTVYIHISPSHKVYVGITCQSVVDRWQNGKGYLHVNKKGEYHQPAMAHAINKYGWSNFEHIIFDENLNQSDAETMERLLIALWQSDNPKYGYNIREGGGSSGKVSEATKQKMREAQLGKRHSEETKLKISRLKKGVMVGEKHPNYGKPMADEAKQKLSRARRGKFSGPDNPMYGKKLSEEARKKISKSKLGRPSPRRKPVHCIELNQQWESVAAAEVELGVCHVGSAASGTRNYAGRHPVTNEPLHWRFIEK